MLIAVAATSAVVGVDAEASEGDAGVDAGDPDAGPQPMDPRACDDGPFDADAGPRPPKPPYCYAVVDPLPPPPRGCGCHHEPDVARATPPARRE